MASGLSSTPPQLSLSLSRARSLSPLSLSLSTSPTRLSYFIYVSKLYWEVYVLVTARNPVLEYTEQLNFFKKNNCSTSRKIVLKLT